MIIKKWNGKAKLRDGYDMATVSFINDIKFNKQEAARFFEIIEEQSKDNFKDNSRNVNTMAKVKRGKELLNTLFPD
ncbi:hypothetical protein GNF78_13360 [Clostridium perfringens]|uniref:hypothetical protein n=1 Tax=Clostridium perfringens TaxID=1502 RepID=UPI002AC5ED4F|nr:hypothetical protein [Clostridium perfringens]MDZ5038210.1 hypothetical protein [Clostridium perfringens]